MTYHVKVATYIPNHLAKYNQLKILKLTTNVPLLLFRVALCITELKRQRECKVQKKILTNVLSRAG